MKKNLFLLFATIAFISACKKTGSDVPANTWTLGGTTYTAATVIYLNAGVSANLSASTATTSGTANGLTFVFTPPPSSSTQLNITNSFSSNSVYITASKITGSNTTTFYANGVTSTKANVTINNNKVGVSFSGNIWLYNLSNTNDSLQLSIGTITQQ